MGELTACSRVRACVKKLLTVLLPFSLLGPGQASAQTVNICDRTPVVQERILSALEAEDCAAVDSQRMAGLRILDFTHRVPGVIGSDLIALQAGDFDGLAGLQRLNLYFSSIPILPDGIFEDLSSLQWLNMSELQGRAILPDGIFDNLTDLRWLYLAGSGIASLPDGVFDSLTKLTLLHLSGNYLYTLPDAVFSNLGDLEELDLSYNRLADLPEGLFNGLNSLLTLNLRQNRLTITSFPDGIFYRLVTLQHLQLGKNHLVGMTLEAPPLRRLLLAQGFARAQVWGLDRQTEPPERPARTEQPEQSGGTSNAVVNAIADDVAALQTHVEGIAAKVDALQTRVDGLAGSLDRLAASVEALRESLGRRMDGIEAEVADAPGSRLLLVPIEPARREDGQ